MAFFTPLPLPIAQQIGQRFGLQVEAVTGISGGSVNSNYELHLLGGERAFLRIFEAQIKENAAKEIKILHHLAARGVPTPRPLRRIDRRSFLCSLGAKPVAVFPWVEGDCLPFKNVTPEITFRVGKALAHVHLASADFNGAPKSRFSPIRLLARLAAIPREARNDELAGAIEMLTSRLSRMPDVKTPRLGVIHGDLFRDNVLWNGPEIAALIDFESASRGSPAFDLSVTLLAWCYGDDLDAELCRALVAGYQQIRPISTGERAELFYWARLAAVRFAVTRITDFELRPRGTGVWRDYRRFMARLRKIEELGEAGLLTHLAL